MTADATWARAIALCEASRTSCPHGCGRGAPNCRPNALAGDCPPGREALGDAYTPPRPAGGDLVRLTREWAGEAVGSIGIVGGIVGEPREDLEITFGWYADGPFVGRNSGYPSDRSPEHVSCSGGPGALFVPASRLVQTDDVQLHRAWKWKDSPRAGGGQVYQRAARVWEWDGSTK